MTPTHVTVAAVAALLAVLAARALAGVRIFDDQPESETLGRLGLGLLLCAAAGTLLGGIAA